MVEAGVMIWVGVGPGKVAVHGLNSAAPKGVEYHNWNSADGFAATLNHLHKEPDMSLEAKSCLRYRASRGIGQASPTPWAAKGAIVMVRYQRQRLLPPSPTNSRKGGAHWHGIKACMLRVRRPLPAVLEQDCRAIRGVAVDTASITRVSPAKLLMRMKDDELG